jgi:hypothetical protein
MNYPSSTGFLVDAIVQHGILCGLINLHSQHGADDEVWTMRIFERAAQCAAGSLFDPPAVPLSAL